ncbi:unnamed protein product [Adineta steineri]|uniref:Uncharacterized protein n=1 Tax=Adineta steineri TaxID=433720 RepID=A0A818UM29_9BILA|nr:unnamed protein product [Adineta steineri]CAF0984478.1 unnamed protein product [Adineta steineri]CAF1007825.1 unnamed protein product [Adineta steineri]CAF3522569.1 unnamed protein product [Adineta steineri]CAF3694975.1 unnamed protein product [Adineta steineri]
MAFWDLTDSQRMGIGLIGFAFFFILLGFALFFDRALLALGNIFLIVGVILLLGLGRARTFFVQPDRLTGSACFFAGIALLLLRWPIVGVIFEIIGFYKLFGGFLPVVISVTRSIPGFGLILSLPYISTFINKLEGTGNRNSASKKSVVTTIPSNPSKSVNIGQELGSRNMK